MNKDPKKRPKFTQIKNHIFFKDINWEELEMKKTKPPRLGAKWLQLDEYSEKIKNYQGLKTVEDEHYYFEE